MNALDVAFAPAAASLVDLRHSVQRWEAQQTALPSEFRIRQRLGYPDPSDLVRRAAHEHF